MVVQLLHRIQDVPLVRYLIFLPNAHQKCLMNFLRFLFLFAFTASRGGCTCSGPQSINTVSTPNSAPAGKPIQLAIWSNYIRDDVLQNFTAETGYPVVVSNDSSNEELLSKMQAGANGYDVIVAIRLYGAHHESAESRGTTRQN